MGPRPPTMTPFGSRRGLLRGLRRGLRRIGLLRLPLPFPRLERRSILAAVGPIPLRSETRPLPGDGIAGRRGAGPYRAGREE